MLLFLHGTDAFSVNRRRSALQKAFVEKYPGADVFVFDFEDNWTIEDVHRALAVCEGGLFAVRKMVVFLHPFELGETEKILLDFLADFVKKSETQVTLLFVNPRKTKKTDLLARFLTKHADKEELLEKPEEKNILPYIKRELVALDREASFSREALQMFVAAVKNDTARIHTELEKLVTFKPGGVFEISDIALLSGTVSEQAIFEALDALGQGDRKRAVVLFHREASGRDGAYPVLAMCAWQVRRLLLMREMFDRGIRRVPDISLETKLPSFAVQKMLGSINNFPLARIKQGLSMLSDFDTECKRGGMDPHVALSLFVWKF